MMTYYSQDLKNYVTHCVFNVLVCSYDGNEYQDGDVFMSTSDPCNNCTCLVSYI